MALALRQLNLIHKMGHKVFFLFFFYFFLFLLPHLIYKNCRLTFTTRCNYHKTFLSVKLIEQIYIHFIFILFIYLFIYSFCSKICFNPSYNAILAPAELLIRGRHVFLETLYSSVDFRLFYKVMPNQSQRYSLV